MRTAKVIRDERAVVNESLQALHVKAKAEKRSLTGEETSEWETLYAKSEALKDELSIAERQEAIDSEMAATRGTKINNHSTQEKRDIGSFSILRMIQSKIKEKPLDGIEAEMHQEAVKEARSFGNEIGGMGIPSMVMNHGSQKRDNSITMPTQPEDGSAVMIKTQYYGSMLEMLRNQLVCERLGCTYLNDLTGNLSFTSQTERPIATWKPEVGDLDKTNMKFGSTDFGPKRLGTYIVQSKQFLLQTSPSIEQMTRQEIVYSLAEGVDKAAIVGTGANNQPTGILVVAGTNTQVMGTNGAVPTRALMLGAETTLNGLNIPSGNFRWLLNSATVGKLKNTLLDAGSGKFLMEANGTFLEYPVVVSNVAPSNGTKGTGTALSAAVFGNWSDLYIGQWGGIDLLVDPYTLAVGGQVKIVAQGFFNIHVNRPASFVKFVDIVTV